MRLRSRLRISIATDIYQIKLHIKKPLNLCIQQSRYSEYRTFSLNLSSSCFVIWYWLTIIGWGFCDIQNNQGRGKSYQPKPTASVNTTMDNTHLFNFTTSCFVFLDSIDCLAHGILATMYGLRIKLFHFILISTNKTSICMHASAITTSGVQRRLKAVANEGEHCCGNIVADANVSPFARARNICCGRKFASENRSKKCFWILSETFCVRNKCFPVCSGKHLRPQQ